MAIKTKAELMESLKNILKDNTTDEALSLVEDVSDTYDELHNKAEGDGTDWKAEYEKNDAEWRQRYQDRFFSGTSDGADNTNSSPNISTPTATEPEKQKTYKFEELFSTPNGKES